MTHVAAAFRANARHVPPQVIPAYRALAAPPPAVTACSAAEYRKQCPRQGDQKRWKPKGREGIPNRLRWVGTAAKRRKQSNSNVDGGPPKVQEDKRCRAQENQAHLAKHGADSVSSSTISVCDLVRDFIIPFGFLEPIKCLFVSFGYITSWGDQLSCPQGYAIQKFRPYEWALTILSLLSAVLVVAAAVIDARQAEPGVAEADDP